MKKIITFILTFVILFSASACTLNITKNTITFDKKSTLVIAHRGLSGIKIENTKDAFIAAGERSYYGIEADVRRTADGKFVICHDNNLERVSNTNITVESSTLEELLKVELSIKNRTGEGKLCSLSSYISVCKTYNKHAVLELKSNFNKREIEKIIDEIFTLNYLANTTFISFNYTNLEYVRDILPNQSVQFLFSKKVNEVIKKLINDKIDAGISFKVISKNAIKTLHEAGLKVNCWTLDSRLIAEQLSSLGVDYITTNILE